MYTKGFDRRPLSVLAAFTEGDGGTAGRAPRAHGSYVRCLRTITLWGVCAFAVGQWFYAPAVSAARVEDQLGKVATDEIGKNTALKKQTIALGKKVYKDNCVSCHGADLKGVASQHVPDLSDRATLYGSDNVDADVDQIFASDIETTVKYGIRADHPQTRKLSFMPSFGGLDPQQEGGYPTLSDIDIADLTEYLISLQGKKADAARAAHGKALYADQGGCFDCHSKDAEGNPSIGATDLTSTQYLYGNDRESISASIREGRKGTMPAYEKVLTPAQIKAVAYYLFSVREAAEVAKK